MNFKLLIEKSPICIAKVSLENKILYANPAWSAFTGYSNEELASKKYTEITHPDDIDTDIALTKKLSGGEITEYRLEKRYIHKSGKIIWGDLFVVLLPDEQGDADYSIFSSVIDITDKKENEVQISHSEKIAKMGSWEWDILNNVTKWSDNMYRLFGSDPGSVVPSYDYFMGRVHPNDQFVIAKAYEQLLGLKNKIEIEFRVLLPGNAIMWMQNSIQPYYINDKLVKLRGVNVDITERKTNEIAILKKRDALRQAQVVANMGSWEYDPVKDICSWSKNMFHLLKVDLEHTDLAFDFLKSLVHPDDRHKIIDGKDWLIKCRKIFIQEFRCILPDNDIVWIESHVQPICENNQIVTVRGVFIDITERKMKENELLIFSKGVEQSPISIIITDNKANIEYVNQKFTEITGYGKDEVITRNPNILRSFKVNKQVYVDMWAAINSGKVWKGELINKRKSGDFYWERKTISSIVDEYGNIINYVSFGEDITSQKKIEQDLIAAKEKAEESDMLKTAFIQNISHEIRTPMNSLLGFVELLKEPDLEPESRNEFVEVINQSGTRLLNTVNDIMEISKIESGVKNIHTSAVNVHQLIQQNIISFKARALKKGLDLRLSETCLTGKKADIQTDQTKLGNILVNLTNNALKFTETGHIEIGNYLAKDELVFFVKDTGIGISETHKELIFDRFTQVDLRLTRTYEGTGLGLSIVKAYVDALKGRIWINSEVGKGSTFYFSIPYVPTDNSNFPLE